jgi:predicted transcriptional regulator of viral defense system
MKEYRIIIGSYKNMPNILRYNMLMKTAAKKTTVIRAASHKGVISAADTTPFGVSPNYLYDLVRQGDLQKVGRGLFSLPGYSVTEHHGLVEVAAHAPSAVICLLSALQYHRIGTQMPHAIWLAISHKGHKPTVSTAPIEVARMSPASLNAQVETHIIEGVPVRIFSAAKTVADCFKFRSTVGLDVALEALKDVLARRKATPTELYNCAVTDRVWNVMRPYMEVLP